MSADSAGRELPASNSASPEPGTGPSSGGRRMEAEQAADNDRATTDNRTVTAADVDSNWWYVPAVTAGLTLASVLAGIGTVGVVVVTDTVSAVLPLLLSLPLLLVLVVGGYGSMLAIHLDAKAIREAGGNWQPSVLAYAVGSVL
ncbi:hypothetical protein AB7C87_02155 [Natrarchaeobius sp. A-rgal3]|uniref:hypothetical protein n=1 Tax=Natrarchaeobius versutus TaxID=1679078 RepID=UPI00350F4ED7